MEAQRGAPAAAGPALMPVRCVHKLRPGMTRERLEKILHVMRTAPADSVSAVVTISDLR
jgi:hypothetical protein